MPIGNGATAVIGLGPISELYTLLPWHPFPRFPIWWYQFFHCPLQKFGCFSLTSRPWVEVLFSLSSFLRSLDIIYLVAISSHGSTRDATPLALV
jgi:hypothetical protein